MFDHVKFGVSDYAASKAFFLKALEPLGVSVVSEGPPTYGVELSPKGKALLCLHQTEEKPAHLHLAFTARIAGAAIGSAAGGGIGGTNAGPDIAAAGIGAAAGYGAHRLIQSKGGYRAVAEAATNSQAVKNAGGRMLAALRRALAKTAEGAV